MNYEDSFESFDSECNQTHPETVGSLKKGSYIILKGFPCKITDISSSKTGKHGHAKTVMTGIDIFTGKKYEGSFPTSHQIDVPDLKKVEYAIAGIDLDNWISLVAIGKESSTKEMKLPCDEDSKDMVIRLKKAWVAEKKIKVCVLSAMGQDKIISFRENYD